MTKTEQLKKLNQLVLDNLIDIEDFYVIDLDSSRISFQGELSQSKLRKYQDLVNIEFDTECRWFKGSKDGIRMVLTID